MSWLKELKKKVDTTDDEKLYAKTNPSNRDTKAMKDEAEYFSVLGDGTDKVSLVRSLSKFYYGF